MLSRCPVLVLSLLLGACATTYTVVPARGGDVAAATADGLALITDPNAWNAYPFELTEQVTPIWIEIRNQTTQNVRVSYADFALVGNDGFRYPVISPYTGEPVEPRRSSSPAPSDSLGHRAAPASTEGTAGELEPSTLPSRARSERLVASAVVLVADVRVRRAPPARRRYVYRRGHHHGFYVYPRVRAYFGIYPYWPGPYVGYPYYGAHVYYWGPYVSPRPSHDVIELGLPEGVVQPGGQISGFVYFARAVEHTATLRLTWAAHTPDGHLIDRLRVDYLVIEE